MAFNYEHSDTAEAGNDQTEDDSSADLSLDILCHTFSEDGLRFAMVTDNKKLLVWEVAHWDNKLSLNVPRRPTCIKFCNLTSNILVVSDKAGDVHKYTLNQESKEPSLLLGHLSMVLDVAFSPDDKYIISADRDEKIRVTLFSHPYIIHSYCLGHTRLVSSLQVLSDKLLLSGGGDSCLRLWDYTTGEELDRVVVGEEGQQQVG